VSAGDPTRKVVFAEAVGLVTMEEATEPVLIPW
jgi:hypothetical protein